MFSGFALLRAFFTRLLFNRVNPWARRNFPVSRLLGGKNPSAGRAFRLYEKRPTRFSYRFYPSRNKKKRSGAEWEFIDVRVLASLRTRFGSLAQ